MSHLEVLDRVAEIARAAGDEALTVYASDFAVYGKDDAPPVTEADRRAEAVILDELAALTPAVPIISEKQLAAGPIASVGSRLWLVDPLDGTQEFIKRNGEFTINIALVENARPVLGVVLAPALKRLFLGIDGVGAWLEEAQGARSIRCRRPPEAGMTIVARRSHGDAHALESFLAGRKVAAQASAGSSLKFCLVAAAEADLYPRFGRTMEWDTAAGHAVLLAAGGCVTTLDGADLRYGKPGLDNPHFVAWGLAADRSDFSK
jgi:3'(2'), 5'-bisphosphate nucleotidase